MNKNLSVSKSIEIKSSRENVWRIMTDPDKIKIYLFGTEAITDWEVGSPIIFQGDYEGHKYVDKGNVLINETNKQLKYNYWTGFSGLPDMPDNYCLVTYTLESLSDDMVRFTWTQDGFANEEGQQHSEKGLPTVLAKIKELAEGEMAQS